MNKVENAFDKKVREYEERTLVCPSCKDTGFIASKGLCETCKGTGRITKTRMTQFSRFNTEQPQIADAIVKMNEEKTHITDSVLRRIDELSKLNEGGFVTRDQIAQAIIESIIDSDLSRRYMLHIGWHGLSLYYIGSTPKGIYCEKLLYSSNVNCPRAMASEIWQGRKFITLYTPGQC